MTHSVEVEGSMASENSVRKSKKYWVKNTQTVRFGMQVKQQEALKSPLTRTASVEQNKEDIHVIQTLAAKLHNIPELKPVLAQFYTYCNGEAAKLKLYDSLVTKMRAADDSTLKYWSKILGALSKSSSDVHHLFSVHSGLEVQSRHLARLAGLFDYPPYPEMHQLSDILEESDPEVDHFIRTYDLDPQKGRTVKRDKCGKITKTTEAILDEQFDTTQVERIIKQIAQTQSGIAFTSREQYDLAQQVIYINAVGRKHSLTIKGLAKGPETSTTYNDLTKQSRAELKHISDFLIRTIRKPGLAEADKLKAQLNLMAVLREQYFRVTGRFANTTQLITVLMALKNPQHNVLLELGASEDNSITNALVAVMQWVNANGGTIDLCTANREYVAQEYQAQGNGDFFTSLGIESSCIEADSRKETYRIGGINYSTVPDLALYRARAKLENELLIAQKEGHETSSHLILAQPELTALRNQAYFRLVCSSGGEDLDNPYTWIYLLINEFINQKEFKDLDPETCWDEKQDLIQLKKFLESHSLSEAQKKQLEAISDEQLNSWIDAAIEAQRLVDGIDFVIPESKTKEHRVIPKSKAPQIGFSFSQETQHFLSARLQNEHLDEGWVFTVEPESSSIVSTFARDLFDDYKQHGHILALSGVLGTTQEVAEQLAQLNMEAVYRIPTHLGKPVKKQAPQALREPKEYIKRLKEVAAVERYYLQRVAEMQEVVLLQFDEWLAFLRPFHAGSELARLTHQIQAHKEQFARKVEALWSECLVQSNSTSTHSNPYEHRDKDGTLQTDALDKAMHQFENTVEVMWTTQCGQFESLTAGKIKEDSRQALHCDYLLKISIINELRSYRLAQGQKKLELAKERKKAHRYLETGLDVNGAMISYSDGEIDSCRLHFIKSQAAFFIEEIATHIEKNIYLSESIKTDLGIQIRNAHNLFDLVLFLKDYARCWLPEDRHEDKYALQPVVQQILFACNQVGIEEDSITELRKIYLDHVCEELVGKLKTSLSWAAEGHRGLGYMLERTAVTNAAADILQAVAILESATTAQRPQALKYLYKLLALHQAELADLWIFSFGHKNTRTLINETLANLDGLTYIGCEDQSLDADFIQSCKEEALTVVMLRRFVKAVEAVEQDKSIKESDTWMTIRTTLNAIQTDRNSIYVFHEMYHFVMNEIEKESLRGNVVAPLTKLRGALRNIWDECSQKHQKLMDESKYFAHKAKTIKTDLADLPGVKVEEVTLKTEHSGFSTYLDLTVKGSGTHEVLANFNHYHSSPVNWLQTGQETEKDIQQTKDLILSLRRVKDELLPSFKTPTIIPPDLSAFPEQFYEQVVQILQLWEYANAKPPKDLSIFEEEVQNAFHDYQLINTSFVYDSKDLNAEIAKLRTPALRIEFNKLYQKIHQEPQARSVLTKLWDSLRWTTAQETPEDLSQQYVNLKSSPEQILRKYFYQKINMIHNQLADEVDNLLTQTLKKQAALETKKAYADEKIAEEKAKGSLYHKRFKDMEAFYEFMGELKAHKSKAATTAPVLDTEEPLVSLMPG